MNTLGSLSRAVIVKGRTFVDRRPELSAWAIMSALVAWLNLRGQTFVFYFDAADYWNLRLKFDQQGTVPFSLLNYDDPLRAYLQPLFHYAISRVAALAGLNDAVLLEIIQAVLFSALFTLLIPGLVRIVWGRQLKFYQVALFGLCVLIFWQGYFFYPLSDFWALLLIVLGVYLTVTTGLAWWAAVLAGLAWGGAALVRPSYIICLVPLPLWAILYARRVDHARPARFLVGIAAIALGVAVVFAPAVIINARHFGVFSPMPQTQIKYGGNLYIVTLNAGITSDRYETSIGASYPSPAVLFLDPQGQNVLMDAGIKFDNNKTSPLNGPDPLLTLPEYVKLVFSYPVDFLVIYAHHLFNSLDIVYNTPYVEDVYGPSIWFRLLNYSLWFLTLSYVVQRLKPIQLLSDTLLLMAGLLLPALVSVPIQLDVRYALGFHFVAYAILAFYCLPSFLSLSHQEKLLQVRQSAWVYVSFVAICFVLSANTFAGLQFGHYVFQ